MYNLIEFLNRDLPAGQIVDFADGGFHQCHDQLRPVSTVSPVRFQATSQQVVIDRSSLSVSSSSSLSECSICFVSEEHNMMLVPDVTTTIDSTI